MMRVLVGLVVVAAAGVTLVLVANQPASGNNTAFPPFGSFQVQLNTSMTMDPSNHQSVLHIPTNMTLQLTDAGDGRVTLTGPSPYINVDNFAVDTVFRKDLDDQVWLVVFSGYGDIGIYSNILATFGGRVSPDGHTLTGTYQLGANDVFPGHQPVTYEVKAKPPGTATQTGTAGPPTQTGTPGPPSTRTRTPTPTFTWTPTRTAPATPTVPTGPGNGDVNKDGRIESTDGVLVLQHDAGFIDLGERLANADVNRDGRVDARDANLILQFVVRRITRLPTR